VTHRPRTWPALYYDAQCPLCTRSAWFIDRRDRTRTLRFASLHGDDGDLLRAEHPALAGVDSLVWVEAAADGSPVVRTHSDAVLAVGRYLGGFWRALATIAHLVPRVIRDVVYRFVARHRHIIMRQSPSAGAAPRAP
jgi:predicted DCC family thiol-disulfide oxidoreductase YuxK